MLSAHSCLVEKKKFEKKVCKCLMSLVKIVQSVIATLVKTSKGKCTAYFIFSGTAI